MGSYAVEDIRNIALVGDAGAGKTTLVESVLFEAGVIPKKGSVQAGTTCSDFEAQEKVHGHSLNSAVFNFDYQGSHINLIDTPGYLDFFGRALAVLPAVETVALVVNAQAGIGQVGQRLMQCAAQRGQDRLIIINDIDVGGVDLERCLAQVRDAFGSECLPLNLPAQNAGRVVDCFFAPNGEQTDFISVQQAHTELVDQVIEVDEDLMEVYLEQGQELKPEQLHDPFEKALRDGHLIPVCFVSSETGAGIRQLLDIFHKLMPNPTEGNPPPFVRGEGGDAQPVELVADTDAHALAHVFKVAIDPFVGRLSFFRVHQGKISKDSQLFIGDGRKPFRVAHLLKVMGKQTAEIDVGIPGDICAVAKVEDIVFDSVLHDSHEEDHIHLKSVDFPAPMQGLAVHAKARGDEQKISDALHKVQIEDPSVQIEHNAALNETVIRGLGDLHLRVILENMKDKYNVEVETHPPRIPYLETITKAAEGHYRHKKQTGGAGQFGEVFLRVKPLARGEGFAFVDRVVGGVIPRQFIPAVEKGVRQALESGVISGYRMQDLEVEVYDGKYHSVDSKEIAFVTAGKKAFIDAVQKAGPAVLEPIVRIAITAPNHSTGDITSDLSGRRGRISSTDALPDGSTLITGEVPLSELNGYQSQLKAITGGRGSFTMEFGHYDPVPAKVQQTLVAGYKPSAEED